MTPDSFKKVNPDVQPGEIPKESKDAPLIRKVRQGEKGEKDFKKILEGLEEKKNVGQGPKKETSPMEKSREAKAEELKKNDPATGQPASIVKESKVPPRLGKEMPAAPTEEPRAKPYIDQAMKDVVENEKRLSKAAKGEAVKQDVEPEEIIPLYGKKEQEAEQGRSVAKEGPEAKERPAAPVVDASQAAAAAGFSGGAPPKAAPVGEAPVKPEAVPVPKTVQDIVNQIVEGVRKVQTVKTPSEVNTTITLNHPGNFEGVRVTVTSYKSAAKEINVKFENLTQQAKETLDLGVNRTALHQALDQKGYTVHMIVTSTYTESRPVEPGRPEGRGSQQEGGRESAEDEQGREERERERE